MDPRVKDRRRGVQQRRGRHRLLAALVATAVALAAVGYLFLRSSDVFAVQRVFVPVTERVPEGDLRAAVMPVRGVNLLRVSTSELEERIRSIPYVREAAVYRSFPDALEVHVREYVPAARVRDEEGGAWLIADDGRVLDQDTTGVSTLLFILPAEVSTPRVGEYVSPQVVAAIPLARTLADSTVWPAVRHPIEYVGVSEAGELLVVLGGGGELRLGDATKLDEKLTVSLEVIDRYLRDGKSLDYVDVRVPTRVVAKAR